MRAESIFLEDVFENAGAQLLKQVAQGTNDVVGDGTTTATVLAQSILENGFNELEKGKELNDLLTELKEGMEKIILELKERAEPMESKEDIYNVALISTNNDVELSTIIADCYDKVKDNIIFQQSTTSKTHLEIVKGMRFISSYLSSHFINVRETNSVEYSDGSIYIHSGKITDLKWFLVNVLKPAAIKQKPLVIIAEDVSDVILHNLLDNMKKEKLYSVVLQAPGFGFGRTKTLEDIAVYTGTEVYKEGDTEVKLGSFDSIITTEHNTIIRGMHGDADSIENRIQELELSKREKNKYEIAKLDERIAKFKNGIGIIHIGASSPVELRERMDRLEDAVNSVKAASEEGVISGGGTTLMDISLGWDKEDIYSAILMAPYRQIIRNQHEVENDMFTYDVSSFKKYKEKGILDPVKVTRTALENAVSVASTILTTECIVS